MNISCDISWFTERDIDVWLAEELRVNPAFARWFVTRVGLSEQIAVPAARTQPSVVDETGETDVEAIFNSLTGKNFAALIENKISATFQNDQLARYLRRGELGLERGKWHGFAVVLFAPAQYGTTGLPNLVRSVSFEEAADFLKTSGDDSRMMYRAKFLEHASKGKIIALEDYDPFRVEWWNAVDVMLRREFGDFFVIDRRVFPKTTYINPKCADMASYLRVDLKGHLGEVDLSFKNIALDVLTSVMAPLKPADIKLVRNGKSAALRIDRLPPFLVSDGLGIIDSRVRAAYAAAHTLLSFWRANKQTFDSVAGVIPH